MSAPVAVSAPAGTGSARPVRRPAPPIAGLLVDAAAVVLLTATALAPLWPVHQDLRLVLVVVAGAALGAIVVSVVRRMRGSGWLAAAGVAAAYLLTGVGLAVPSSAVAGVLPSAEGFLQLLRAPVTGWRELLTIDTPAGSFAGVLLPALMLALVTGSTALWAATGGRRVLALVPFMLALALACLFGTRAMPVPLAVAAGVGVLGGGLLWIRLRGIDGPPRGARGAILARLQGVLGGVLVLGVVAAGTAGAALVLPEPSRLALRDAVQQPFDARERVSPLAEFRRFTQDPLSATPLLRLTGVPEGERLRFAVLESYDGVVYRVGGTGAGAGLYRAIPVDYPEDPLFARDSAAPLVDVQVEVLGYTEPWVPLAGTVLSVSGADAEGSIPILANAGTQTAVVVDGLASGGVLSLRTRFDAPTALRAPLELELAAHPQLPEELEQAVADVLAAPRGGEPAERLRAAIELLRGPGYLSHGGPDEAPSRSGHSASRLLDLLQSTPRVGDEEQYTVAAALLASELGYPVRVVVGAVSEGEAAHELTGADVTAWLEVATVDGWVALDATPTRTELPAEEETESTAVPRPENAVPPSEELEDAADRPDEAATEQPPTPDTGLAGLFAVLGALGLGLGVLLLLAAPLLIVLAAKALRRRRRVEAPGQRERIIGSWLQARDLLVDHGYRLAPGVTRGRLVEEFPVPALVQLAGWADHAAYAPEVPSEHRAELAWRAQRSFEESLLGRLSRWQRFRVAASPLSLGWGAPAWLSRLLPGSAAAARRRAEERSRRLRGGTAPIEDVRR